MNVDVVGSPDGGNTLEEYSFRFCPEQLALRLCRFRTFTRGDEFAPWAETGLWQYPDIPNASTLPQPDCPAWAVADAKTLICQKIQVHP